MGEEPPEDEGGPGCLGRRRGKKGETRAVVEGDPNVKKKKERGSEAEKSAAETRPQKGGEESKKRPARRPDPGIKKGSGTPPTMRKGKKGASVPWCEEHGEDSSLPAPGGKKKKQTND